MYSLKAIEIIFKVFEENSIKLSGSTISTFSLRNEVIKVRSMKQK